jgi:hypothetical protein
MGRRKTGSFDMPVAQDKDEQVESQPYFVVLIMPATTFFVDEKAKAGTLCPALDISALNGASAHLYQVLNIVLQQWFKLMLEYRGLSGFRRVLLTLEFFNVSAEMASVPTFCAGREWFKIDSLEPPQKSMQHT